MLNVARTVFRKIIFNAEKTKVKKTVFNVAKPEFSIVKILCVVAILAFVMISTSASVVAQPAGYKPVVDNVAFKQQFSAAAKKLNTIQSDFVQEKNLAMLSEKITSNGKFWFKKDNLVRMEYTSPFKYLMIINKNNVFIKDDQKENKISAKSNKMFQQINRIIVDCVQGTALDNKDFTVKTLEGKDGYLIFLSPLAKGMKELFANINVVVDRKDYSILRMEMVEAGGDNTIIKFTNKQLNIPVADALFAIK